MAVLFIDLKFVSYNPRLEEHPYKEESKINGKVSLEISEDKINNQHVEQLSLTNIDFMMPMTYEKFHIQLSKNVFMPVCKEVPCIIKSIDGRYDEREIKLRLDGYSAPFNLRISSRYPSLVNVHVNIVRNLKPSWCHRISDQQLRNIFDIVYDSEKRAELERYIDFINTSHEE